MRAAHRSGPSWQVVSHRLPALLTDPGPLRRRAATRAPGRMARIVVTDLEAAVDAAR